MVSGVRDLGVMDFAGSSARGSYNGFVIGVSYGVFAEFHTGLTGLYGFYRVLNL